MRACSKTADTWTDTRRGRIAEAGTRPAAYKRSRLFLVASALMTIIIFLGFLILFVEFSAVDWVVAIPAAGDWVRSLG